MSDTLTSYYSNAGPGVREMRDSVFVDVENVIQTLTPHKTPFIASMGRLRAANVLHEWLEDNLLSCNPLNPGVTECATDMRQSFATAGKLFRVIDAPTRGVVVPYRQGADIIAQLCGVFHPAQERDLLRRAQRYSVNLFPNVFRALQDAGALHETRPGSGVWHLDQRFYSPDFGVSEEAEGPMDTLIVS